MKPSPPVDSPAPPGTLPRPGSPREATPRNEELAALLSITDGALSTLDLPELLDALLARLIEVMKADAGAILLLEPDGRLDVRATRGFEALPVPRPVLSLGEGFAGRIAQTGEPRFLSDVRDEAEPPGFLQGQEIVSVLGVPLMVKDRLVGVCHVDWRERHDECPADLHLMRIAADRCASGIVNARLHDAVQSARAEADRTADRLRLALEVADLGVWDWDIPARKVVWDAAHERMFGLVSGSVDGRYEAFERLVHPDDRARLRAALADALRGAPFAPEFRIVRKDGEIRWLSVRGTLRTAPDGSPLRLLGVTCDVTEERGRAEERELLLIRERGARRNAELAERQVVNVLERVTDSFVALDNSWRYTYVSRKAAETFGRRPEDLLGRHIWTEFPEGVGQPFQKAYERAAAQQVPVFMEEYYPPYDRWFENRVYPSPDGLSIFFSDITERKRTEEKMRQANEQLRALSARLEHAREEEAVRIAREIHDELGQLITALKLGVSGVRARLARMEGEEARELLGRAEDVSALAEQLQRSVHKISEELRPAALDQLGLKAAVASHLFELRQRTGIAASLAGGLGERRLPGAVETGVFRVVQELLTNVLRHAAATKVRVTLGLDGNALTARVADDGRGIRPEEEGAWQSLGLLGIRERVAQLNGTFTIRGGEHGTEAVITVPLPEGGA